MQPVTEVFYLAETSGLVALGLVSTVPEGFPFCAPCAYLRMSGILKTI